MDKQSYKFIILQVSLPPKYEHVFLLRLMPVQRRLYRRFMSDLKENGNVGNPLKAFAVCCKIWNHPDVLHNFLSELHMLEVASCQTKPLIILSSFRKERGC